MATLGGRGGGLGMVTLGLGEKKRAEETSVSRGLGAQAEMEALDVPRSAEKRTLPWAAQMVVTVDLGAMFG